LALHVHVDRPVCRGSRSCVRRAPATFSLDAEGKAVVAARPGDRDDVIREAARSCPFFAIRMVESGEAER
jgi:ferredoxin